MIPKQKADELMKRFRKYAHGEAGDKDETRNAKLSALFAVEEIEKALTEYGHESMELQNMDSEWRYWDSVKTELFKL